MAQTNVNIRMDMETKKAFDKFCAEIGLSVSSAFNIFAKTVVREQRIPFALTTETPNSVTLAALKEVEDMKRHPELCKGYQDVDRMMEDILGEYRRDKMPGMIKRWKKYLD